MNDEPDLDWDDIDALPKEAIRKSCGHATWWAYAPNMSNSRSMVPLSS